MFIGNINDRLAQAQDRSHFSLILISIPGKIYAWMLSELKKIERAGLYLSILNDPFELQVNFQSNSQQHYSIFFAFPPFSDKNL